MTIIYWTDASDTLLGQKGTAAYLGSRDHKGALLY